MICAQSNAKLQRNKNNIVLSIPFTPYTYLNIFFFKFEQAKLPLTEEWGQTWACKRHISLVWFAADGRLHGGDDGDVADDGAAAAAAEAAAVAAAAPSSPTNRYDCDDPCYC